MAYDEKAALMKNFRVDRISSPKPTGKEREGEEDFKKIDLNTQKAFSMYSGERKRITIRCTNNLLDVMVERFGTTAASYSKTDSKHFSVNTAVEVSNQFYGWLAAFGNQVKITFPEEVIEGFKKHLDIVRNMY